MLEAEQIKLWEEQYANDQEGLYTNPLIRFIFDIGHRYIARKGRFIVGNILDIGSGMGYHLKFEHLSAERRYVCMDRDSNMLAKIEHPFVQKILGTCGAIPLPDKSMNLIIASHILEHLPALTSDLNEVKRVLKTDGKMIVVLPCDPGFLWKALTYFSPSRWRLKRLGIDYDVVMRHEHVNSHQKCVESLQEKFLIEDESYFPFGLANYNLNLLHCLLVSPLQ